MICTAHTFIYISAVYMMLISICIVINLSEVEKTQFQVSFVGSLSKQGHGVKSWKKRLVHIVHTRMTYFDIACTKKGRYLIRQLSIRV